MADWSDLQYKWSNMPNVDPQREWNSLFASTPGAGPWGGATGFNEGGGPQAYTYQGPALGAGQDISGGKYYNPWFGGAYNPATSGWVRDKPLADWNARRLSTDNTRGWSSIPLAPDWFTKMVKGAGPQQPTAPTPDASPFDIRQINQDIRQGRSGIIQQGPGMGPAGQTDPFRELMKGGVMAGNPSMNIWSTRPDIGMESAWQLFGSGAWNQPQFADNQWILKMQQDRPELFRGDKFRQDDKQPIVERPGRFLYT